MQFLVDIIPAKARRYVYGAVALASLIFGAWQAADHDWKATIVSLVPLAVGALAHANTSNVSPQDEAQQPPAA